MLIAVVAALAVAIIVAYMPKAHRDISAANTNETPVTAQQDISQLPVIGEVTLTSSADANFQQPTAITLPLSKKGVKGEMLDFTLSLTFTKGQSTSFRVMPDDCVKHFIVNDQPALKGKITPKDRCNWKRGFVVDLQPFLKEGINVIRVQIRNRKGKTGFNIIPIPSAH